jgi:hypothetical protein
MRADIATQGDLTVIDATLDFKPEHLPPEALTKYYENELVRSEFALLASQNQYQAQLASHKALLDQRDRLTKLSTKTA